MKLHGPFYEYIAGNYGLIEAVATRCDEAVEASGPSVQIEYDPLNPTVDIVRGRYDAEAMCSANPRLTVEDAEALAAIHNTRLKKTAKDRILMVHGMASMIDHVVRFQPDEESDTPAMLDFAKAEWKLGQYTFSDKHFDVSATRLLGVERIGSATSYLAEEYDSLLNDQLQILYVGNDVTHVTNTVVPVEDALVQRCMQLLGTEAPDLMFGVMVGEFEDENELDTQLGETWLNFQGTAVEDEVGPLLDEVRLRAIAAREARGLSLLHLTELPSVERLEEIIGLLES